MEIISLVGMVVAFIVVVSAILFGFFSFREEKFEDHVAQQAEQDAAMFSRPVSTKTSKTKAKPAKRKKRYSENDGEGSSMSSEREQNGGAVVDQVPVDDGPIEKPKSILKEKKNKSKKQSHSKSEEAVNERHTHFEDDPKVVVEQSIIAEESSTVESAVISEPKSEGRPVVVEEKQSPSPQTIVNTETQASKKTKNKAKIPKEKPQPSAEHVNSKSLLNSLKTANLNATELQDMIDVLLNKQGENAQWKSTTKGDDTELLKKLLQEKEQLILDEKKQSLSAANKLKELRDEIQQERMKQKAQYTAANNKITSQTKELQAMQARMKATHDKHTQEVQTLQNQLRRFQEMVNSSSMPTVQRLQEENAQLKNASMRASQLTADKESLTAELHKLQQSHRQLKADLAAKMEQFQKFENHRQTLEKQIQDSKIQQSSKQEAEKVLSNRLNEVNEELKKAEIREAKLSKAMEEKEQKCKFLTEQLNKVENIKSNDSTNALSSQLIETRNRVLELENLVGSRDKQLRESQDNQACKDKEINELKDKLSKAKDQGAPQVEQQLVKEKDAKIASLNEQLNKQKEEVVQLMNAIEQEKKKNNDLRTKNWKAMEALSATEQSIKSEIDKAVRQAKAESKQEVNHVVSNDEEITKVKEELNEAKANLKKLEDAIESQKKKNNELREKNWKAMDAVAEAEKSVSRQVKAAVESAKKSSVKDIENDRLAAKDLLTSLYPGVSVESSLSYEKWLAEFKKQASDAKKTIVENGDVSSELEESRREMEQLKAECSHYKNGLEDTETMLKKLENHIESEINSWEKKLDLAQQEAFAAKSSIKELENDLKQAKSSSTSHLNKISLLEREISQAKEKESIAIAKVSSLEKELSKSSQSEEMSKLQKELSQSRENEKKLCESSKKFESVKDELSRTVDQLSEVQGQLTTKESEVKSLREEMKRNQETAEDFKKTIATLEEALVKANNDIGKSQESINSDSPEKKKKGIKGAFSKLTHGSKKDKDSKNIEKDEAKIILAYKTEIEELKAELKKAKESEMTRSQQIEKDVAEAMADGKAVTDKKVSSI